MKKVFLLATAMLCFSTVQAREYWTPDPGAVRINWTPDEGLPHNDHIEMSGKQVSVVLRYGVDGDGVFSINKSMVWPMFRIIPNETRGSLMRRFDWNPLDEVKINGWKPYAKTVLISLDGTLSVRSCIDAGKGSRLSLTSTYFPSVDKPALIEIHEFVNTGEKPVSIEIPSEDMVLPTDPAKGVEGTYTIRCCSEGGVSRTLSPGDTARFHASISVSRDGSAFHPNVGRELAARKAMVSGWTENLVLESPDCIIDMMFAFSKIRACESIYQTKAGPMHGPGGESYYAAIWANDQAEYINPYFPFTGYSYGNESALNSFRHFARYMNDEWKPIPSSIIAEGDGYWNGAGDRGDAAMIAYGAARYALARGSEDEARELMPLIEWCLEFCHRKLNGAGVVESDSDELEGRFPSGDANLCTSSLYYDALLSAACLADDLGMGKEKSCTYRKQAAELRKNIGDYFEAEVEGYETYAYYEGNDILRAWICIPLTAGIYDRAEGTVDALFSPRLWTENGLLTQAGDRTFWDRSTLYALRGAFMAGATEKALAFLSKYSRTRLLGEHVPYAVEAWPEGGQRHLSAESGLYGRVITEGLFGIRPDGLDSFTMTPHLPQSWDRMKLGRVHICGENSDILVERRDSGILTVTVTRDGRPYIKKDIKNGSTLKCEF